MVAAKRQSHLIFAYGWDTEIGLVQEELLLMKIYILKWTNVESVSQNVRFAQKIVGVL